VIRIGTQVNQHAVQNYDVATDTINVTLEPVKEKYLHFLMPWKRKIYSLATDGIERIRPKFVIYWHKHPFARCTYIRMGWV
jgi:hypothetical protein